MASWKHLPAVYLGYGLLEMLSRMVARPHACSRPVLPFLAVFLRTSPLAVFGTSAARQRHRDQSQDT